MKISEMKISNKIAAIFMMLIFIMGLGGFWGLYNVSKIAGGTEEIYQKSFKHISTLSDMEKEFISLRQEVFLHIIVTDQGSKSFLDSSVRERVQKINKLMKTYQAFEVEHTSHRLMKGAMATLQSELDSYWNVQTRVLELSSYGRPEEALSLVRGDGNRAFNAAINHLKRLLSEEMGAASKSYQRSEYLASTITLITVFLTIAAIVMSFALWRLFTSSIVKPILIIEDSAKKVAKGDLAQRALVSSGDELGSLAREFNVMANTLQDSHMTLERKVSERTDELKHINEELLISKLDLEAKNEELARANRMKSQFLANVSHELRTPLNSIIGFSELLQEKSFGALNDKQTQYVKFIHTSGNHLLHLINSILDLSKIEAGRMELSLEEFSLAEIFHEIMGSIKPIAHKRGISLDLKDTIASPVIKVDKAKFKQILYNLLSNAVKFNKDGGKIMIDWDILDEPAGMTMQRYLYITVEDTGMGIKKEDIGKLFREFEQLDPSVTREHGGTGLGLALTKKLVELHKGHIRVDSEPGKGCKFTVKLPQGSDKVELRLTQVSSEVVAMPVDDIAERPLILVAGESEDVNHLIRIYLSGGAYEVETARDGIALVEKARLLRPFAIVCGVALSKKDGWEVMKELKLYDETKEIPVVIVSATDNKELGFALGAVDYIEKPIDKAKLVDTLNRLNFIKNRKRRKLNVLVVDDEPQVLTLIGDILEKEDFVVHKAGGGEEAVRMAIQDEPDLIVLDLMMPGVSGYDVVDRLKDHPVARNIPVVIFTAKDITSEDKQRLGDNIDKIIRKASFSKEDLIAEIRLLELSFPDRANLIDRTTKLFNKRYFDILLSREISRSHRYKQACSVMIIDIDNFSAYNQEHGVSNGDGALCEVSRLFTSNLRKADCVTRYGGDSFAILLPGITSDETLIVAEKVRKIVEKNLFPSVREGGHLTVSIGAVSLPLQKDVDVIGALEESLSKAYGTGGNKVVLYKG
ncbi:sensory box histidine kinase/response regulator [hydrothermal vent metagenome]|uniref:histidine kinase n=1 Tax=hydrothermal vent metagenome TaxID=652676 RepID=A0A3B0QRT8_9ZZZZ